RSRLARARGVRAGPRAVARHTPLEPDLRAGLCPLRAGDGAAHPAPSAGTPAGTRRLPHRSRPVPLVAAARCGLRSVPEPATRHAGGILDLYARRVLEA